MLTSIGRFLRKLRIDQGEILKDMAEKLNVTVSFLSAVENGKKKMPTAWNKKICDVALGRRELAVSFARKFTEIDDSQVEEINRILQGGKCKK